uniref:Nuclear envelope pore membrane protein POM 121C n=1 Tax=Chinchilla lanigera TaxID=34839 RepID=A0A8C2V508_CHILA
MHVGITSSALSWPAGLGTDPRGSDSSKLQGSEASTLGPYWSQLPGPGGCCSRGGPHEHGGVGDYGTLSSRFVITPRRRYPIQQAQYSLLGVLPTVCWNGCHKKPVLSARNSRMVCSPVTVRIAPPDSKPSQAAMPEQIINSALSSPSSNTPDPCSKETVLNALRERRKRTVEEEDQIFVDGQENKRRRHDSSGSGHSAFEPLVANGVPASFVPKPGTLKRGLTSQNSDDHLNKRSRTSSVSSLTSTCTGGILSSSRNAITSSYSSTRGLTQLRKRSGPPSSPFSSPASSRSQTPERPAKKTREEEACHHASSSTPLVTDKESQGERVAETTTCKQQSLWTSPSPPGSSGRRKRKIQLLPCRRGDRLTLPPPPELGYSVTAEDLDLEKKASLQFFNKVLEDKANAASNSITESPVSTPPSFTFSLPAAVPASSSAASLPAPGTNPLLESLKNMQRAPGSPSFPEPAAVVACVAPTPPKTPSLLAPLASSLSGPLPATSSDTKPTATLLAPAPAVSTAPATDTKPPAAPQAETPAKAPASPGPAPAPKQSTPFEMLSPPPSSPATPAAAPSPSSASPMFKPIFEPPPKVESEGPLPSGSSLAATATSSATLPTTTSTATPTFKPIFGSLGQPASLPLSAPFFKATAAPVPAAATATPAFPPLATATSTVASVTTASTSADSALKLPFSFEVKSRASTLSSTTSTTASTAQPFLFGASPAGAASFTPSVTSMFQFDKSPAVPASTAVTSFGQSLPSTAQTAASSSSSSTAGFGGFGSTLTALAPATTSQSTLTFSHTTTPAFNIPFGSAAKPPVPPPPYPGANPQPTFGATDGQQQGSAAPALPPGFGSSFTFGNSAAPAPAPAPPPPAFGSSVHSAFGSLRAAASAFGTPASTQQAFGSSTAVFSFSAVTTAGFGATTQTASSGTSGAVFSSSAPSPFTFGPSGATAGSSGGFRLGVAALGTSSTSGAFSFGAGQSGTTGAGAPFGGALTQSTLGTASQSIPFTFSAGAVAESKPVFGGTATPTFGQSTPNPGMGTTGSSLSFGTPSTPAQGFAGVTPFGSAAPSFSIGAGSKTPGARQRLQARRQHTRKK